MNEHEYVYTRMRRDLGSPCVFENTKAVVLHHIIPQPELQAQFTHADPSLLVVDNIPPMSSHSVNTDRILTESRGQSHFEGGWPKEIDANEPQDTIKWRKRLDKDPQFQGAVAGLCTEMTSLLERNQTIDIFEEYFKGESAEAEMHSLTASTVALFKDQQQGGGGPLRTVSRISWHPDSAGARFIASYSLLRFQKVDFESFPVPSYVWEVESPNTPVLELLPPSPLVVTQYYSRNADLVAGGLMDGRVCFFDVRTGSNPVIISTQASSHQDAVFDVSWIQSKTHSEAVSTSPDGRAIWWDSRNMSEPTEVCILTDGLGERQYGGCCIEWQQEAGPTKYLVGTEEGVALSLTKKPKKSVEVGGWFGAADHGGQFGHYGPIYSIKRNMFHPKYFMTVGDWGVRLWAEELKTPIFQTCSPTANSSSYLTSGGWSCSRPGVFFASRFDGVVDFYDYHYQMNQVAYSHKVGDIPLSCVINSNSGRLVAVGDSAGTVTLVELCEELCQGSSVEKTAVGSLLDREQRRERNLDSLKKQQKVFNPLEDVNKSIFTNKTINQHEYVAREKEWLENVGLIDRSWDLTVKAGL